MSTENRTITREQYAQTILPALDETRDGQRMARWSWYYTRKQVSRFGKAYMIVNPSDLEELTETCIESQLLYPAFLQELNSAMPNHRLLAGMICKIARNACVDYKRNRFQDFWNRTNTLEDIMADSEGILSEDDRAELAHVEPGFDEVDLSMTLQGILGSLSQSDLLLVTDLLNGLSVSEICDRDRIPARTMQQRVSTLNKRITSLLGGDSVRKYGDRGTERTISSVYDELQSII